MADTTFVSKSLPAIPAAWLQDLNNFFYRGAPANVVSATTRVVTPLVISSTTSLQLETSNLAFVTIASTGAILPMDNAARALGSAALPWNGGVFTNVIDTGANTDLFLRQNGINGLQVVSLGGVDWLQVLPSNGQILLRPGGSSTNPLFRIQGKGTGTIQFETDGIGTDVTQFQILHTAGATRNITVTGSVSNPTIGVTGGSLGITPNVVITGQALSLGTNPAQSAAGINLAYATSVINIRNSTNTGDLAILFAATVNGVANVTTFGSNVGTVISGRSGAGAPTASDLASGNFTVWHDTVGNTTKLYYNNAGGIQSVALT